MRLGLVLSGPRKNRRARRAGPIFVDGARVFLNLTADGVPSRAPQRIPAGRSEREAACAWCGDFFVARERGEGGPGRKYCSPACRAEGHRRKQREWREADMLARERRPGRWRTPG